MEITMVIQPQYSHPSLQAREQEMDKGGTQPQPSN